MGAVYAVKGINTIHAFYGITTQYAFSGIPDASGVALVASDRARLTSQEDPGLKRFVEFDPGAHGGGVRDQLGRGA
jgi:hypothetical protein